MKKEQIEINCSGDLVSLDQLEEFQGDLKSLSKKNFKILKDRIRKYGFDSPLYVWKDEEGKFQILDGHQRFRTIGRMIKEGFTLPEGKLPVVYILADSVEDAKERLLGYISQFGEIDLQGLHEFTAELNFDEWKLEIDLPEVNLEKFEEEFLKEFEDIYTPEKPEIEFSPELMLEHNYVILYFDDPFDFQVAIDKLKLKKVKSGIKTIKSQKIGLGRVIPGKEVIKRLKG